MIIINIISKSSSPSWKSNILKQAWDILGPLDIISIHCYREENYLPNFLANHGIDSNDELVVVNSLDHWDEFSKI